MSRTVTYNYKGEEVDSTAWDGVTHTYDIFKDDDIWVEAEQILEDCKDPKMSCRETVLDEAKRCICTDRQNQYGSPENSFNYISDLWTAYMRNDKKEDVIISPTDVAIMMILLKVARTARHKSYSDNYVDMAGYAALAAELAAEEELIDELCD